MITAWAGGFSATINQHTNKTLDSLGKMSTVKAVKCRKTTKAYNDKITI